MAMVMVTTYQNVTALVETAHITRLEAQPPGSREGNLTTVHFPGGDWIMLPGHILEWASRFGLISERDLRFYERARNLEPDAAAMAPSSVYTTPAQP